MRPPSTRVEPLIRTVAAGTMEVVLRYCYRSRLSACEPMPDRGPTTPVTLAVTVTTPG
jgi:hypothetical protein